LCPVCAPSMTLAHLPQIVEDSGPRDDVDLSSVTLRRVPVMMTYTISADSMVTARQIAQSRAHAEGFGSGGVHRPPDRPPCL